MKKTTKKNPSKASQRKVIEDLEVKPNKGGAVRGGAGGTQLEYRKGKI